MRSELLIAMKQHATIPFAKLLIRIEEQTAILEAICQIASDTPNYWIERSGCWFQLQINRVIDFQKILVDSAEASFLQCLTSGGEEQPDEAFIAAQEKVVAEAMPLSLDIRAKLVEIGMPAVLLPDHTAWP